MLKVTIEDTITAGCSRNLLIQDINTLFSDMIKSGRCRQPRFPLYISISQKPHERDMGFSPFTELDYYYVTLKGDMEDISNFLEAVYNMDPDHIGSILQEAEVI